MSSERGAFLELEASCELDLTLTIERAVRVRYLSEGRIVAKRVGIVGHSAVRIETIRGADIQRVVLAENLRAVEDVETFSKQLQVGRLGYTEPLRYTQV